MGGLSDEDADEGDVDMLDEGAIDSTTGKSKTEREEMLRLMMEAEGTASNACLTQKCRH